MKVKATDQFIKLNVKPFELDYIPEAGEIFEVSEVRAEILKGNNSYKAKFIEELRPEVVLITPEETNDETRKLVEVAKKEPKTEKAVKKTTKKKK